MGLLSPSILWFYSILQGEISPFKQILKGWVLIINFYMPSDFGIMTWMGSTDSDYPWKDREGTVQTIGINNLESINGVLRSTDMITINFIRI